MLALANIMLSVAMIAVFALSIGGAWIWARKGERRRGLLMLAAAFVILANVAIWTVPMPG